MPLLDLYLPERKRDVERWLRGELPAERVKENRGRAVWRAGDAVPRLYVKRFPRELLRDRARAEARMLEAMARAGLPCPRVVAVARDALGSLLITEEVPGTRDLMEILEAGGAAARDGVRAFGALLRRVHDAGFDHRDFHAGNVLVRGEDVFVIDVHRASRRAAVPRSRRIVSLAFAALSLRDRRPATDVLRFLRAYGLREKADVRAVLERLERRREEHFRSRQKRCFRESSGFSSRDGLWFRRGVDAEALRAEVEAGREEVVKDSGKERLARLPSGRFVKRTSRLRARAVWRNAHALDVRGIPTPRLLAWGPGWVAGEWIDGPNLRVFARDVWGSLGKPARDALIAAVAWVVRRMHERRIYHKDLKGANVVVGPGLAPFLLDLDRVRLGKSVSPEERRINLAQLNASISLPVTRSERLRFFRRYAPAELWRERKAWVGRIMTLTAARKHHWPPKA